MDYLRKFDFSSQGPQLFVQREPRLKTVLGGVISAIVMSIVLFFVWYIGYDIVYRESPIVLMKEENLDVSYLHQFNNSTTFIGMLVENEQLNKVQDLNKILKFSLHHYVYTKNMDPDSNEIWKIDSKSINLVPCTGYWNYDNKYSEEQLSQFLCGENFNYTLGGYWSENQIDIVVYEIRFCNHNSRSDCLSREEMNNFVKGKYLNFYFMDQIVDLTNYQSPLKLFGRNIYMMLDSMLYKEMELFFRTVIINSDIGFLFQEQINITSFQYDRFSVDSKSLGNEDDPLLASIWVYSISKTITYKRSYIKIQDIAANVGGIVKFLMLAAYLVLYLPSIKGIKVRIMNEIFDFNIENNVKVKTPAQAKEKMFLESATGLKSPRRSINQISKLYYSM